MPTYAELAREPWWAAEFQPPTLAALCERLRAFYGVSAVALGSKGDNNHLYGYHRSARWVLNSIYCTNTTYSVSETAGNRSPGDEDWLCAIDATIPREQLLEACKRLDAAVRAGRLEKVTEWYGNTDGDLRVDGYNNIRDTVASSDASHLWHLHISLDRGRAGENHDDLYAVLTGEGAEVRKGFIFQEDGKVPGTPHPNQWWFLDCNAMFRRPIGPGQTTDQVIAWAKNCGYDEVEVNTKAPVNLTIEPNLSAFGFPVTALGGSGGGGGVSAAEVRTIVDQELDEAFSAGADKD